MKKLLTVITAGLLLSSMAWAGDTGTRTYEVTVTNLSKGVSFTPLLGVIHNRNIALFELGQPSSDELADLAEGGNTAPLQMMLDNSSSVYATTTTSGLLGPGESVSFTIEGRNSHRLFSLAGMLLPTNDAFVAVNSIRLPRHGPSTVIFARAYDAGSELNDELCASIPGPFCGGTPFSEGQAEGYVYVSNGIHGNADLSSEEYNWNNPIASVSIHLVQ
ncbi:MAG: spondin domain-containing protein [Xanthomonadales bacterium]|nr:spondin domain-containing protein [Xanthomonadales bacterium]